MTAGNYLVKFYDSGSGWLHSEVRVFSEAVDAVKTAIERSTEDVSRHRAAVFDANTGEGVSGLDSAATKAQLQAQLDSIAAQLAALSEPERPADSVPNVVQPPVSRFSGDVITPPQNITPGPTVVTPPVASPPVAGGEYQ